MSASVDPRGKQTHTHTHWPRWCKVACWGWHQVNTNSCRVTWNFVRICFWHGRLCLATTNWHSIMYSILWCTCQDLVIKSFQTVDLMVRFRDFHLAKIGWFVSGASTRKNQATMPWICYRMGSSSSTGKIQRLSLAAWLWRGTSCTSYFPGSLWTMDRHGWCIDGHRWWSTQIGRLQTSTKKVALSISGNDRFRNASANHRVERLWQEQQLGFLRHGNLGPFASISYSKDYDHTLSLLGTIKQEIAALSFLVPGCMEAISIWIEANLDQAVQWVTFSVSERILHHTAESSPFLKGP